MAKELLLILWERGWIDPGNLNYYTLDRRQDGCGILIPDSPLRNLIAACIDFEEEVSLLQQLGREMAVTVD